MSTRGEVVDWNHVNYDESGDYAAAAAAAAADDDDDADADDVDDVDDVGGDDDNFYDDVDDFDADDAGGNYFREDAVTATANIDDENDDDNVG